MHAQALALQRSHVTVGEGEAIAYHYACLGTVSGIRSPFARLIRATQISTELLALFVMANQAVALIDTSTWSLERCDRRPHHFGIAVSRVTSLSLLSNTKPALSPPYKTMHAMLPYLGAQIIAHRRRVYKRAGVLAPHGPTPRTQNAKSKSKAYQDFRLRWYHVWWIYCTVSVLYIIRTLNDFRLQKLPEKILTRQTMERQVRHQDMALPPLPLR